MQKDPSGAQFGAEKIAREKKHLEHDLEHKKLHAKKPSGAQFEARKVAREKVAREKAHPEHDLKHKKRHAKTSLWSMIWRRKSCTKKNNLKHGVEHKKLHAKRTDPEHDLTIRFEAQKVEKTWRDFFCKMKLCSVQF